MAKNGKGKEVAVKKGNGQKKKAPAAPPRLLSALPAWEREIERMLEDFPRLRWPRHRGLEALHFPRDLRLQAPSLDMYEEKGNVVVKAELPGMSKDEIEVTLNDSTLTLKGEKKKEEEVKEKDYYRRERSYGSFVRSVELPSEVKSDQIKANFKDGVLEVRMPKTEEAKKKSVSVKID